MSVDLHPAHRRLEHVLVVTRRGLGDERLNGVLPDTVPAECPPDSADDRNCVAVLAGELDGDLGVLDSGHVDLLLVVVDRVEPGGSANEIGVPLGAQAASSHPSWW